MYSFGNRLPLVLSKGEKTHKPNFLLDDLSPVSLMGLLVNWMQKRKELMSLKILREISKIEMQRKKKKKTENSGNGEQLQKV